MIDNIYIIHWKELKERKKYLESQLFNYNVCWIDFFDRNTIKSEDIDKIYSNNEKLWNDRVKYIYNPNPPYRDLRISEICNSMSHIYVLDDIIDKNYEYGIVLEDDVIFKSNFFTQFDDYFDKTPKDFDIVFLGSSFSPQVLDNVGFETDKSQIQLNSDMCVYEKFRNPKTRCVDAYILKKSACEKLKTIINEIVLPYDFDLAYFIKELDLKVYWWEPGLVFQGSQAGYYSSSIR